MNTLLKAKADLADDKMKFECTAGESYKVTTDFVPPLGSGQGPTSLELFLSSLCSCMGGTLAVLLRHQGKEVKAVSVEAQGRRRIEHPTCFEEIKVDAKIKSPDTSEEEALKVLGLAEQSICPVAAMLKGNIELSFSIELEN